MERSQLHFRHSVLSLSDMKKSATEANRTYLETYDDAALSYASCYFWFQPFKSDEFDVEQLNSQYINSF